MDIITKDGMTISRLKNLLAKENSRYIMYIWNKTIVNQYPPNPVEKSISPL